MKQEKISFHNLFYIFIFGCFTGWFIEGIWTILKKGILINHSALVIGPFNVIYGIGAVILTIFLYRLKNSSYLEIFVISFIVGSLLEYSMSYLMELLFGFVAWSYRSKPFNINGRICLTYSIFWGVIGIFWLKIIYPFLEKIINKFNHKESIKIMKITLIFLLFDVILTFGAIYRGQEYEKGIPPSNKTEEIIDKYFGVNYLNNMFNNRWNKK